MKEVLAKELILENFKSFGRRTTIPLLEGFTTISGPNGSGKSNILDSILFCLGLTTTKLLRAERLPDLINTRSARNEARVTLRLEVKGEPNLVEISRVVKVGKNDYHSTFYLDGRQSPLQAIHDRLSDLNISPRGHNIVLQGDVTRILTMGPVERRRIIDDLAGVGEFDDRIDSARKEMGEAERHMESTRVIQAELAMRLAALKEEREQALAFLAIRGEKERLEKCLLVRRYSDSSRNLASTRTRMATLSKECGGLNDEILTLDGQMESGKTLFLALETQIQELNNRDRVTEFAELEEIKQKLARSASYLEYVQTMSEDNTRRQAELAKSLKQADAERTELTNLLQVDESERRRLEAQMVIKREAIQGVQKRIASVDAVHTQTICDLPGLRQHLEEGRELVSGLTMEEQKLTQESSTLGQAQVRWKSEAERLTAAHAETKAQQKKRGEELKETQGKVQSLTYELYDQRAQMKARQARLVELQIQLRNAVEQYSRLEGLRQASEYRGSAGLALVLNSGIAGIHGRVADLAQIPEEYRIAIESAAGRRLDFVVVADENVAVRAIDLLKERRMGRITCLPLTKIRGSNIDSPPRRQGILGLAIDLVRFDASYRNIFGFVLGDTVVIDNIRSGLPFQGQYRMVSLEGDLLEKSGAMTGGSPPTPRTAAPELDLAAKKRARDAIEAEEARIRKELPALEQRVSELEESLQKTKQLEASLSAQVTQLTQELSRLTSELNRAQTELDGATKGLSRVARDLETLSREKVKAVDEVKLREDALAQTEQNATRGISKELSEELKFLDGQLREVEDQLRAVKDRAREREMQKEFHQKNLSLYRKEYGEIEDKLATLSEQAEAHRLEQTKLKVRHEELSVLLNELSTKLGSLRRQREDQTVALEALSKRKSELKVEFVRREAELTEAKNREATGAEEVARLTAELVALSIDPAQIPEDLRFKGPVRDLEASIAGLSARLAELGAVNLLAIDQAKELEERLSGIDAKLATLERERQEILSRMAHFGDLKKEAFFKTYQGVKEHYERIYADLSEGSGDLVLESPDDPFAGGLVIRACPKGKDMKRIEALSGGEKSLAALAFVFAFQTLKPAPFYIFDEVDMFLDSPNTERLARMLRQQAESTQFIVVSLKKCMIEKSHRTVGVYADKGGYSQVAGLSMTGPVVDSETREVAGAAGSWN